MCLRVLGLVFFCFLSPICLVWEWEALLPREWLAFGRTPEPLEKQAENSGKICAASWGEGKKGGWEAWRYSQAVCQPGAQLTWSEHASQSEREEDQEICCCAHEFLDGLQH